MHPIVSISHIKTIQGNNQLEWSFTLYQSVANQLYETSHYVKVLQISHMTVGYFKVMPKKYIFGKAFYIYKTCFNQNINSRNSLDLLWHKIAVLWFIETFPSTIGS